jgi:predicted PolB exonuclease-like 3'-5' exonuclease
MIKTIKNRLLSFDIEWIPDPKAAEALFGITHEPPWTLPDAYQALWEHGGATAEQPRPFLKLMLSRIVSIAGIFREQTVDTTAEGGVNTSLKLVSLPTNPFDAEKSGEKAILETFLKAVGTRKPQLVGYNSLQSDVPILLQRAIVHGIDTHGFAQRPEKPWEGVDYFSSHSDYHIDLAQCLGTYRMTPRLDEMARMCAIPGKVDVAGDQVWELYMKGRLGDIVAYNEFDALTTHLLWARVAFISGQLSAPAYEHEQRLVRELCEQEAEHERPHFKRYLREWDRLKAIWA